MKRGRGRPRRAGTDEEILAVALEMLREKGYRDLNVDEIAERLGIAKTTIYRRWPTKGILVAAAIEPLATQDDENLATVLRDATVMFQLIADADDVAVLRAVVASQRPRIRRFVDSELSADMIIGALVTRMLL